MHAIVFDLNGVLIASEYLSARFENEFCVPSASFGAMLKERILCQLIHNFF